MSASYAHLVPTPARKSMNTGLSAAKASTLVSIFGAFPNLPVNCGEVQNAKVRRLIETRNVGPFRATGIKPALDSLQSIFAEVKSAHPDLYKLIGTEGMLCYRKVRGRSSPSNHAAGTAIDLKIGGVLPDFNDSQVPYGLIVLYGYFHRHGWYWAAGYNGRTDPMHKEVADETLKEWHRAGLI